jgi:predicted HAD superfamily Cof-like phosphohydrolase
MDSMQRAVMEFHRKFGQPVSTGAPEIRRGVLRAALLAEEAKETIAAIAGNDLVEAIDGLCDTIYVCLGAALEFGVDLQPFFAEVHRTNMAKEGGATRADGKIMKPEGWTPPDIAGILASGEGRIK